MEDSLAAHRKYNGLKTARWFKLAKKCFDLIKPFVLFIDFKGETVLWCLTFYL